MLFFSLRTFSLILLLILGAIISVRNKKLTSFAAIVGVACGVTIFIGAGYSGILMLAAFFIMGTLSTGLGRKQKQHLAKAEDSNGRKAGQVLANAGVATILALLATINPEQAKLYLLMLAASLASATADTLSSELGVLYGRRFYNCLSWKREEKGLDGVISLEGTLIGILGAIPIALIYTITFGWNTDFFLIIAAATAGNFSDSLLGALLERKKYINNDAVNFLSTLIAAIFCLLI